MAKSESAAFRRFVEGLDARPSSYDEYVRYSELDIDALEQLDEAELRQAHDLLIDRLSESADIRVVRVLAGFDSPESEQALRVAFRKHAQDPWDRGAAAAEALRALIGREAVDDPVAELNAFISSAGPRGRELAVETLGHFGAEPVRDRLYDALDDDDEDTRIKAAKALLSRIGLKRHSQIDESELWVLEARLSSAHAALRKRALEQYRELAHQAEHEQLPPVSPTPERSAALTRFIESLAEENAEYDLEALKALEGTEREWMEYVLLERLDRGDPRVVRALAAMEATVALDPLREILPTAKGELQFEVEEAIDDLEELER